MNSDGIARYYETLEHLSFGRALERSDTPKAIPVLYPAIMAVDRPLRR